MATIAMPGDVARLVGDVAEKVENRSLLLDKFLFHKLWPVEIDEEGGGPVKWDDASRWSFLRIADGASQFLKRDAEAKAHQAGGKKVHEDKQRRLNREAGLARMLANVAWNTKELADLRAKHTRRFIALFRSSFGGRSVVTVGRLESRLAINLADSLVQNAGICLDRLCGLPYIPGSAVKGVSRHAAMEELKAATGARREELFESVRAVFGTASNDFDNGDFKPFKALLGTRSQDQKGAVAFLPAYPLNEARIVVDLTNVHYPEYYRTGKVQSLATESPRPNPFPAVDAGAKFAFCILLSGGTAAPHLLEHATRWLHQALTVHGLGAKTAAGYGWFSVEADALAQIEAELEQERKADEARAAKEAEEIAKRRAEETRKSKLNPLERRIEELRAMPQQKFAEMARQLSSQDETTQRAFLELLAGDKEKRQDWKRWKERKPDLANSVRQVAESLGRTLP